MKPFIIPVLIVILSINLFGSTSLQSTDIIDLKELNRRCRNALVKIEFTPVMNLNEVKMNPGKSEQYGGVRNRSAHGTGFFISENEILTNSHVIDDARKGSIILKSPATGNVKFKCEVVGLGSSNIVDLAVLRLPKDEKIRFLKRSGLTKIQYLKFGNSDSIKQSDPLAIMGYPSESDELKIIQAEVTGRQYHKGFDGELLIKHQFIEVGPGGVVQRGNSGGPAFNKDGEVIGIPTLGDYLSNQGWLIPVEIVKKFLPKVKRSNLRELDSIPDFGVTFRKNTAGKLVCAGAEEGIVLFELGVEIGSVKKGSLAERWELNKGDIIIGFRNKKKRISCALDFEGYKVVTGKMAQWPQNKESKDFNSNIHKAKTHLEELFFTSDAGDEIDLWYLPKLENSEIRHKNKVVKITRKIEILNEHNFKNIGLYEKPEYFYWGDFVVQDFNSYNISRLNIPNEEALKGGVVITYVEPNSLASHRELNGAGGGRYDMLFCGMGRGARTGSWQIIESVNNVKISNLDEFKKELNKAQEILLDFKKSGKYEEEKNNLYPQRYVSFDIRSKSNDGKNESRNAVFPIDDAIEFSAEGELNN